MMALDILSLAVGGVDYTAIYVAVGTIAACAVAGLLLYCFCCRKQHMA